MSEQQQPQNDMGLNISSDENYDDVLPAGTYRMLIKGCEARNGKNDPSCRMLSIQFQVLSGEHQNRIHWDNFVYQHTNQTAARIGKGRLQAIKDACGIAEDLRNPSQLVNKTLAVTLAVKDEGEFGLRNTCKKFESLNGAVPTQATQPQANPNEMPW